MSSKNATLEVIIGMMMIDVLQPLLGTKEAKRAERPPKVMRRSERRNNLQICPRQDSNTGGAL